MAEIVDDNYCKIDIKCKKCKTDKERSFDVYEKGGWAEYERHWFVGRDEIHIMICTDDSGRMIGDGLRYAAQTLHHELIHARDACKRRRQTSCGEFTTAALNAGKFDDKICTEIHAYAQQNKGVTANGLGKNDVIRRAVDSVLDGCEFYKAKPSEIDENFLEELTKKVEGMYEKCKGKGWEAVQ